MFTESATEAFKFLTCEFHFEITATSAASVTYEKRGFEVCVHYDAYQSFGIGVTLGWKCSDEPRFNLGEALRSCGAPETLASTFQCSNPEKLQPLLLKLADNMKKHCSRILRLEDEALNQLLNQRNLECSDFNAARELRYAREDAESAWKNQDFAQVVDVLSPLESLLSDTDRKRLSIARKRIQP